MEKRVEAWQLQQRRSQPLELKIRMSQQRIRQWYNHWQGDVCVSFSGGLDSTVLLHLIREIYPDVPAVCVDALLYPEIRKHIKSTNNVTIIRPEKSFKAVIEEHGYPVISKRVAQYVNEVRRAKGETATKKLRLTGIRTDGTYSSMGMIPLKWQYLCDAPFQISDRCCDWLKKKPFHEAEKTFGWPFVGIRVDESQQREQTYYVYGCNAFSINRPRSWPLAFWTHKDIWEYIREFDVPYSSLYNMGYTGSGCFACMFGVHLEGQPNRFQKMQKTHPNLWRYCEKIGIPEVLDYIGVSYQPLLF